LLHDGIKIAGSTQRTSRGAFIQQGIIRVPLVSEDALEITVTTLITGLTMRLERAEDWTFTETVLPDVECNTRYTTTEWNVRR
jgi:hypothetical protein